MLRLLSLLPGPDLAMAFASKLINGTLHVGLFLSLNCDNRFEQLIFLSVYANLLPVATCLLLSATNELQCKFHPIYHCYYYYL